MAILTLPTCFSTVPSVRFPATGESRGHSAITACTAGLLLALIDSRVTRRIVGCIAYIRHSLMTLRGHSINESGFGYLVNLDPDSHGISNTTVT